MNIERKLSEQRDRLQDTSDRLDGIAAVAYRDMPTSPETQALKHREHELMAACRELGDIQAELAKAAGECGVVRQIIEATPVRELG